MKTTLRKMNIALNTLAVTLVFTYFAHSAHADIFSLWIKPKVDYISGTGEVFKSFEGSPAYGVEAGVELLSISFWGDYQKVGSDQFWGSANVGLDLDFELIDDLTFMVGGYAGFILFGFPEDNDTQTNDIEANKEELQSTLGDQYDTFVSTYNKLQAAEDSASNKAYGANVRARISLEYELIPFVSVGLEGLMGWHVVLSGEEAASGFKAKAVETFVSDNEDKLPEGTAPQVERELKSTLGAEDVDLNNLKGIHYTAGAFINVKF